VAYARERLGATHLFAGVTHANAASARVLGRLGYAVCERHESYCLYALALD